jgi:3'(2'), 5'-bisphosphate nucleotidase
VSEELNEGNLLADPDQLARRFGLIAVRAGNAIMKARAEGHDTQYKSDGSPVTAADLAADEIIRRALQQHVPDVAVVTEESCAGLPAIDAERFILVDPLDGTREFVKGSDEFTVTIALIASGNPVAGAVYAPALRRLYLGGTSAHRLDLASDHVDPDFGKLRSIGVKPPPSAGLRVVVSRSHLDPRTRQWIERKRVAKLRPEGSSLKFCAVAEGEADVYPRLGPTMEWDTAAGHAVLLAAGGRVTDPDGQPVLYGKPDYRNGDFVAWGLADQTVA